MERTLLRCRACGYIIGGDKLKDVCPACGLPKTVFEPYKENISPKRAFILNLHMHPIAVHFPQAFVVVLIPFIILGIILGQIFGRNFLISARVLSLLLPVFSLPAILTGLIDAKVRFKKLTTPALKTKMIFAGLFFVITCAIAVIVFLFGFQANAAAAVIILLILCLGCQIVLGHIGSKLFSARLGG
ncbi:MAG TPA: rubrerythrin [Desulfomonilia bacterium]|jgi:rubredoxin/uncharacterized membrane protein